MIIISRKKNRFGVKLQILGHFGLNFKLDVKYANHTSK